MTYGGGTYGGSPAPDPPEEEGAGELTAAADLTGFGSVRYFEPPRATLTGDGDLSESEFFPNRAGGSTVTVLATPEGLGTKFLVGTTARVLVNALGEGVRVQPYNTHPNARGDEGYFPSALAALAVQRLNAPDDDQVVPRPSVNRQTWSSDVPISRPAPAPSEALVDLGGFAFGATGLMIPVNDEDVEAMVVPTHEAEEMV